MTKTRKVLKCFKLIQASNAATLVDPVKLLSNKIAASVSNVLALHGHNTSELIHLVNTQNIAQTTSLH